MKTSAFKAARVFVPANVQQIQPNSPTVDELTAFPFFDTNTLQQLKVELPQYIAACEDIDPSHDVCKFWEAHVDSLPLWSAADAKVVVIQPSSASAERAFSILKQCFNHTK